MLKIMVVDDEKNIRIGLIEIINKIKEFEVVCEASNGIEAMKILNTILPDVMIVDMRMPKMSGIELIKHVQITFPKIKKIILSGFEDFNYVRESMKNGALDYLLKPVDDVLLLKLLKEIDEKINYEKEQKINELYLKIKLNESLPFLKDQFIKEMVLEKVYTEVEIKKKFEFFGIKLNKGRYTVIIVNIGNYDLISREEGMEEAKLKAFIVKNITEESISKYATFISFTNNSQIVEAISIEYGNEAIIDEILNEIHNNLVRYFGPNFVIGVGAPIESILILKESFNHAICALKYGFYSEGAAVIRYSDIEKYLNNYINYEELNSFVDIFVNRIKNCIEIAKNDKIGLILDEFCIKTKSLMLNSLETKKLFTNLFSIVESKYMEFKEMVYELYGYEYSYSKEIESLDSLKDTRRYTYDIYTEIINGIASGRVYKGKRIIEFVKEYVDNHYKENITLNHIAALTYVNPNYFCEMFKNQVGENFVDYLTRVRIEKAKLLFKDIRMKNYEISEMVGYDDPNYFSKVFKKIVGITPSEYKNICK